MLDQEKVKYTRGNVALWIVVVVLSIAGLAGNVYKYNTGAEVSWPVAISELGCLIAAGLFVCNYFRKRKQVKE